MAARGRRGRRAQRRKVAITGSHLEAVAPGLDSNTATSIPPRIKHQPAGREGGPPSQEEGSIAPRHQGGTTGLDLTAVGFPRTWTDRSKRGGRCRRSGGCRWPILLQRGGAAWVAPSSSAPASVVRSGVGQLCARTSHCRGGRPDLIARRHSGGGPRARPPGLPCPPPALLYRTNSPLLHHSPNIAARQKHLR
jgi:hypothetical protein